VLGRLGETNEAKVHMLRVAEKFQHDTEAYGILGRVYKDLWRLQWEDLPTVEERQQQAVATSNYLASGIRTYDQAARKKFDYYTGINVVSFVKLLEFLGEATGDQPVDPGITDVDVLAQVVRFAAWNALASAGLDGGQEAIWAGATLGELELVAGDPAKARKLYRDAANHPSTTYFNVNSMLEQIRVFESLGFQYVGPIDGHNLSEMITTLENIKKVEGPTLVHVMTKKGKGYAPAEADPIKFHAVTPFHVLTGKAKKEKGPIPTYTEIFGQSLVRIAKQNPKVVGITAAMGSGTAACTCPFSTITRPPGLACARMRSSARRSERASRT